MSGSEGMTRRDAGDDNQLMSRISRQDKAALQALYLAYHGKLMRFALRVVRRPEDAEEVVNDVFMVVWRDAGTFEGRSRVSTWLMGIAYRRALKHLRKETSRLRLVASGGGERDEPDQYLESAEDDAPLPADALEQQEVADVALKSLPADQRLMVELALVMGHSYPEIAEMADCPVNTVKTRMFHARKRMRDALKATGLGTDLADALGA
ncbi:MAG: sigma-70 family RNA polymerase sigma factor [Pseudomonadota bacterium]